MTRRFDAPHDDSQFFLDLDLGEGEDLGRGLPGFHDLIDSDAEEIRVYDADGRLFGVIEPRFTFARR